MYKGRPHASQYHPPANSFENARKIFNEFHNAAF